MGAENVDELSVCELKRGRCLTHDTLLSRVTKVVKRQVMERTDTGVLIGKQICTEISSLVCTVKSQLNKQSRLRSQGNIKGSKVFKKREVGDQRYLAAEDQNHVGLDLATDDWTGSARPTSSMAKE